MNEASRASALFRATDASTARRRLRSSVLNPEGRPLICPPVYDAMSAKLAEEAGFGAVVVSGNGVSATRLGLPDAGFLALSDMSAVVATIAARTTLSVIADCDTGYGNALSAMRAAEEMIAVGAAGFFIEDQVMPSRCGLVEGKTIVTAEEFAAKLHAVDRVRRELAPDIVLIARTDARGVEGGTIEEVIRRGKLYREAGADVFLPHGLPSLDELALCGREVGPPIVYQMGGQFPIADDDDLSRMGVSVVFTGSAFQPAHHAIRRHFERLRDERFAYVNHAPRIDADRLAGLHHALALEEESLRDGERWHQAVTEMRRVRNGEENPYGGVS